MPACSDRVGQRLSPFTIACDARWLMSYAAGIGISDERYLDTTRPGGVVGHPVFPVAPEWALITSPTRFDTGMTSDETARGVHAKHDLTLHRLVRHDETVTILGELVGIERTRPGARVTLRFETTDTDGRPVWTTTMTLLHLGVDVDGPDATPPTVDPPPPTGDGNVGYVQRPVDATAAHVYTECARIYNPIHTDKTFALAAGLPDIVLHGTASLAIGVQTVLDKLNVDPEAVTRLGGEFRAMVPMPNVLTIALSASTAAEGRATSRFDVHAGDGADTAVRHGFVEYTTT